MAKDKITDSTNQKRVNRLVYLRNENNKTQKEVADYLFMTLQNYQDYEYHKRWIDGDIAHRLSEYYDVPMEFILCESESENTKNVFKHVEDDMDYAKIDTNFLKLIESMGYELTFLYTSYYNAEYDTIHSKSFGDIKQLKLYECKLADLDYLILREPKYKLKLEDGEIKEIAIIEVKFNDYTMSFGEFSFFMDEILNRVRFSLAMLKDTSFNLSYCINGVDSSIKNEVDEADPQIADIYDLVDKIKKECGDDSIQIKSEEDIDKE